MAKLDVRTAVRWASGSPAFAQIPMLLAFSLTDSEGNAIDDLLATNIHVGYQYKPERSEDSLAVISEFHRHGPTFGGNGWYSCIVNHQATDLWAQNEVFICLTVRHGNPGGGVDKGKDLVLAKYKQLS